MPTGTVATTARQTQEQSVKTLRKRITFANYATTVTVGIIPAGASVIGGGIHVVTAFNSSGTDLADVGFIGSTTNAAGYASALSMAAVGFIALDDLATTANIQQTVDTTVTVTPTQSVADATAGVADVIILYVQNNDG